MAPVVEFIDWAAAVKLPASMTRANTRMFCNVFMKQCLLKRGGVVCLGLQRLVAGTPFREFASPGAIIYIDIGIEPGKKSSTVP